MIVGPDFEFVAQLALGCHGASSERSCCANITADGATGIMEVRVLYGLSDRNDDRSRRLIGRWAKEEPR
jgi:hypothetical protein